MVSMIVSEGDHRRTAVEHRPGKEQMVGIIEGRRRDLALAKALGRRAPELAIQLDPGRSIDEVPKRSITARIIASVYTRAQPIRG
jgi:hypothetical protein